jgi:hypothetical protein
MPNVKGQTAFNNICLLSDDDKKQRLFSVHSDAMKAAFDSIQFEKISKKHRTQKFINEIQNQVADSDKFKTLFKLQRRYAHTKTMRSCMTKPIAIINQSQCAQKISPTIKVNEYSYSLGGLNRCKNAYCVGCTRSRIGKRSARIKEGIQSAQERGYTVLFVTLTIPRTATIQAAKDGIRARWKAVNRCFDDMKKQGKKVYFAKALDVTFNPYQDRNRYHLHVHAVVVIDGYTKDDDSSIIGAWLSQNTSKSKALHKAQKISIVERAQTDTAKVSRYVAKMAGLGLEIASKAKEQTKSPLSISLFDLLTGCATKPKNRKIYAEFLAGMKRVNTLNFSRNWADLEDEDEDLFDETIYNIPVEKWQIVQPLAWQLAQKLQIETYQNQYTNTEKNHVDYQRLERVQEVWDEIMQSAQSTEDIELFLYIVFD